MLHCSHHLTCSAASYALIIYYAVIFLLCIIYSFYGFIKVQLIYQFQSELYEQDPFSVLSPEAIKRYYLHIPSEENLCRNSCLFPFVSLPLSSLRLMEMNNLC